MDVIPEKQNIMQLFGANVPYYIDFYQRDYKWGNEQVGKLMEDLFFRFEQDYRSDLDVNDKTIDEYDWYYLNAFVTNEYEGKTFIVDGQQRLTTITLILINLFHLASRHGISDNFIGVIRGRILGDSFVDHVYWMGQNGRSSVLEDLYKNDTQTIQLESEDITFKNLFASYELVNKYLETHLDNVHKLESFILWFFKKVMLVKISIGDSKDVPMVFEVINDRGERLKPYEVLKGKLLGRLDKNEVDDYNNIWEQKVHQLQSVNEGEVDNFFRFYFRSRFVETRAEYREFDGDYHKTIYLDKWGKRIALKDSGESIKRFIREDLQYYADLYYRCLTDYENIDYLDFNRLNEQDRQYLLMLSACQLDDPLEREKIELVSKLFDRYYSILQLTGSYDSNRLTESIVELNSILRGENIEEIQGAFENKLVTEISEAKGVPVAAAFEWNHFKEANNRNLGVAFIRYFFARIEHFIADNSNIPCDSWQNLVKNTGAVNGYHVEHILANNDENKALFEGDEDAFWQERSRLGSLTLLKGKDNQSSSNERYIDKLKTYAGKSNLCWTQTLTREFYHGNPDFIAFVKDFELDFKPYPEKYDQSVIEERQRLLFDISKLIWS